MKKEQERKEEKNKIDEKIEHEMREKKEKSGDKKQWYFKKNMKIKEEEFCLSGLHMDGPITWASNKKS